MKKTNRDTQQKTLSAFPTDKDVNATLVYAVDISVECGHQCGVWTSVWGVDISVGCGHQCGVWTSVWGVDISVGSGH